MQSKEIGVLLGMYVTIFFPNKKKKKLLIPFYDSKPYLFPPVIQILHVHYATNIPIYSCEKMNSTGKNGLVTRFKMNKTKDSSSV